VWTLLVVWLLRQGGCCLAQGREKVKGFIGAHHDGKLSGPRFEFKQMDVEL
jgi:protein-tyrosine phosphatase